MLLLTQRLVIGLAVLVVHSALGQPANDNFVARTPIIGGDVVVSGTLAGATSEAGEPFIPGLSSGQTAWWTWTAPSNGIVTLSASGSTFSAFVTAYTGTGFPDLSLVASNNYVACYDSTNCGCHWRLRDECTFHVVRGQAYQIAVDSAVIVDASWVLELIPETAVPPDGAVQQYLGSVPVLMDGSDPATNYVGYYVPVQTTNVLAGGPLSLHVQLTPAPPNDDFDTPAHLAGSRLHLITSNGGAGLQPAEPAHGGNAGGSSVWYAWTAPASGRVTISTNEVPPYAPPSSTGTDGSVITTTGFPGPPTCGFETDQNPPPQFYPVFAAYTGASLASLVPTDYLPVSLPAYPNAIEFDVVKGRTYEIAFDGNLGTTGTIPLFLALTRPTINDDFSHRIPLHGIYVIATDFNAGATHEAGEPAGPADSTGKSVWWSWTAPVDGPVSIDLGGSDYSFPMAVYTGSSLKSLHQVTSGDGGVSFSAVMGQTYQIAVSDAGGLTGAIKLTIQAPIVEATLIKTLGSRKRSPMLLEYAAAPGQMVQLERSADGSNWSSVSTALAHNGKVDFNVSPAPGDHGPFYSAIFVDFNPK